eukprot:COSAG06_NODE_1162_length_10456_cov_56.520614_11_plen_114_part_00
MTDGGGAQMMCTEMGESLQRWTCRPPASVTTPRSVLKLWPSPKQRLGVVCELGSLRQLVALLQNQWPPPLPFTAGRFTLPISAAGSAARCAKRIVTLSLLATKSKARPRGPGG